MKTTRIDGIPAGVPSDMERFVLGARIYDSSSSPNARVYFIDKDKGYFLKTAAKGTLAREAEMTAYFHSKGLGVQVLAYTSDTAADWLLTEKAAGDNGTHARYLSDPVRLCDTLAAHLRALHETDPAGCPVPDRMRSYFALAEENYRAGKFDPSLFGTDCPFHTANEAYALLVAGKDALSSDVLLHGDYCLPNIMFHDWKLSAFIDLGNAGIGNRHVDLFWGAWTLRYNLKTDKYRDRFLDAYGRDKIDPSRLQIIAAAETFG